MKKLGGRLLKSEKSIVRTWIKYFLIVLIVPVLLNFVAYQFSAAQLEKEITRMNLTFYRNTQRTIDKTIYTYQKIAAGLELSDNFKMRDAEGNMEALQSQLMSNAIDLKEARGYFIYLKQEKTILANGQYFSPAEYFDAHYNGIAVSYQDWLSWLDTSYGGEYLYLKGSQSDGGAKRFVSMRFRMGNGPLTGYLVVLLDDSFFLNRVKDAPFVGDISFEILSEAGDVVAAAGSGNLSQQTAEKTAANQGEGVIHQKIDGRESIVTYLSSPFNDWKYIYATPRQVYLRSMRAISYTQNAVLLIAVLIGLGLIAMLVRKQYAPIQRFLDMLPDSCGDGEESEYKQIEHIIQQSLQVRKKAMDALSEQKKMLQDTFLLKLMRGETKDSDGRRRKELGIGGTGDAYMVAAFYLGEYKLLFMDEKDIPDDERFRLMCFILTNIFSELLEETGSSGTFWETDGGLLCLIRLGDGCGEDEVQKTSENARENLERHFYVSFGAALSAVCSLDGISAAYGQAMAVLEYLTLFDESATVRYADIQSGGMGIPSVSAEDMEGIFACIREGRIQECMEVVNIIIGRYAGEANYSPAMYRYLLYDLCAGIIRTFRDDVDEQDITALYASRKIVSAEELESLITRICARREQRDGGGRKDSLAEEIRTYLNENYRDSDLNVSKTADHFGYVLSYISKLFKDAQGVSIVEYISRLRVEETKKLLCSTDQPLQEIAQKVGFNNVASLIRVFKKYENMTPASYKKAVAERERGEEL